MSEAPVPVFLNPAAGRGRAARKIGRLRGVFDEAGIDTTVITSDAPGDLEQKVSQAVADGASRFVVAGGDGSVHEAVNGLMQSSGSAAMGVVPIGTGNDFAKACGIPLEWQDAAVLLAQRMRDEAPPRAIDVGRMNERYFANGAGIGFDARVTRIARSIHWPIGDLVYLAAVFRALWDGVATPELEIDGAGEHYSGPLTLASISNGAWIGGMFHIAPMARNDDGTLDLVCAAPVSRRRILALLPLLMRGTHMREPEVSHTTLQCCEIRARAPLPSHLDGEIQPLQTRFEFAILPAALRLL